MADITMTTQATPGSPGAGTAVVWASSADNQLYLKDSAGNVKLCTVAWAAVPQSAIPASNNAYDLGSAGTRWRHGYFAGNVDIDGNIDVAGTVTIPDGALILSKLTVPSFFARTSGAKTNVTGDGTAYTVLFDTADLDTNAAFDTGLGAFAAPHTGTYLFSTSVVVSGITNASSLALKVELVTTGRTYVIGQLTFQPSSSDISLWGCSGAIFCQMTAGNTAKIVVTNSGDGIGKVHDIVTGAIFSGHQVTRS